MPSNSEPRGDLWNGILTNADAAEGDPSPWVYRGPTINQCPACGVRYDYVIAEPDRPLAVDRPDALIPARCPHCFAALVILDNRRRS